MKVFQAPADRGGDRPKRGAATPRVRGCARVLVADNHLHDGGQLWRQAVGVLVGRCSGVRVLHNRVHDFDYTGISVGWTWGYGASDAAGEGDANGNIVEWNDIHDIGRGVLSDMGGIYTLGTQTGGRIRYNLIRNVDSRGYGGWGIYPDEGSSHLLIENNIVRGTKYASFHVHYGRENVVRNNIFAFARLDTVAFSKHEAHPAFTFERNLVIGERLRIIPDAYAPRADGVVPATFDRNLYWATSEAEPEFRGGSLASWQAQEQDVHSVVADPRFANAEAGDFTLAPDSPAVTEVGFVPFDLSGVGPRGRTGADALR